MSKTIYNMVREGLISSCEEKVSYNELIDIIDDTVDFVEKKIFNTIGTDEQINTEIQEFGLNHWLDDIHYMINFRYATLKEINDNPDLVLYFLLSYARGYYKDEVEAYYDGILSFGDYLKMEDDMV